jgi:hypothetical protein
MGLKDIFNWMLDSREFLIFLIIALVLLLAVVALKVLEKKFKEILSAYRESRNLYYRRKINEIKAIRADHKKILDEINKTARGFFKEAFNLPNTLEYTELAEECRKRNKKNCEDFCKMMSQINYSGEEPDEYRLINLMALLESVIKTNTIESKQDKLIERELKKSKGGNLEPPKGFYNFLQKSIQEKGINEIIEKRSEEKEARKGRAVDEIGYSLREKIFGKQKEVKEKQEKTKEDEFY